MRPTAKAIGFFAAAVMAAQTSAALAMSDKEIEALGYGYALAFTIGRHCPNPPQDEPEFTQLAQAASRTDIALFERGLRKGLSAGEAMTRHALCGKAIQDLRRSGVFK